METAHNKLDAAEGWVASKLDAAATAVTRGALDRADATQNRGSKIALTAAGIVSSIGSSTASDETADLVTHALNSYQGFGAETGRALWRDLRGESELTEGLMTLVDKARYEIDAKRQDYRDGIPKTLAEGFSRTLKKHEWQRMHVGIARTDLLTMGKEETLELLKAPSSVDARIAELEEKLDEVSPGRAWVSDRYRTKARMLAEWMVNRNVKSRHLLRNAHAIAQMMGMREPLSGSVTQELIDTIDKLTTLYAFRLLDDATRETLSTLAREEPDGLQTVVGVQNWVRRMEIKRRNDTGPEDTGNDIALNNGWKGYMRVFRVWVPLGSICSLRAMLSFGC